MDKNDLSAGADIGPTYNHDTLLLRLVFSLVVPARASAVAITIAIGVATGLLDYNGSVTWFGG